MTDPYKTLGISPTASDQEIKKAYKELVKKYHPDKYRDTDMAELANEKMSEINTAYDKIMDDRKNGFTQSANRGGYSNGRHESRYYGGYSRTYADSNIDYRMIRNLIHSGDLFQAESILNSVPEASRSAEWNFLKGTICFNRGWLNDAYNYIARATQMDPANREYQAALQQMNRQRSGYMNTNRRSSGDSMCDFLTNLCILDACCECLGGDIVPCC